MSVSSKTTIENVHQSSYTTGTVENLLDMLNEHNLHYVELCNIFMLLTIVLKWHFLYFLA